MHALALPVHSKTTDYFVRRVSRCMSTRKSKARPSRRQRALCDPRHGVRQHSVVTLPVPRRIEFILSLHDDGHVSLFWQRWPRSYVIRQDYCLDENCRQNLFSLGFGSLCLHRFALRFEGISRKGNVIPIDESGGKIRLQRSGSLKAN